jgi:hypothetical protein
MIYILFNYQRPVYAHSITRLIIPVYDSKILLLFLYKEVVLYVEAYEV